MCEFAILVPAPILEMAFSLHLLLPVWRPALLPDLLLPVHLPILLPLLLDPNASVVEVASALGKELTLLASGAQWHPLADILLMLRLSVMRERAYLLITPALHVVSAWDV